MSNPTTFACIAAAVMAAGILARQAAAGEPCDRYVAFAGGSVPGIDRPGYAAIEWDPDGDGPIEPWLVVGGEFVVAGGVLASRVAAWDGESWHPMGDGFSGTNGGVGAVETFAVWNGQLVAGGGFLFSGSAFTAGLAVWNGESWQQLGSAFGGSVVALLVHNGDLYAGGSFSNIGATQAFNIARWDGQQWQPVGEGLSGNAATSPGVRGLAVHEGQLIACGTFTNSGPNAVSHVAAWTGTQWEQVGTGFEGKANAAVSHQGDLFVTGFGLRVGSSSTVSVLRWDGSQWSAPAGLTGAPRAGEGRSLLSDGTTLYLSGERFSRVVPPQTLFNHVKWDGSLWSTFSGPDTPQSEQPYESCFWNGQIVSVGNFRTAEQADIAYNAKRWDGSTWYSLGSGTGGPASNEINAMSVYQGKLICAGRIGQLEGVAVSAIAAWGQPGWSTFDDGFEPVRGLIRSIVELDGAMYVVGTELQRTGGGSLLNAFKWDGTLWTSIHLTNNDLNAAAVYQGELVVGGQASGSFGRGVAVRRDEQWIYLGSGFAQDAVIRSIAVDGDSLYAGGQFTIAGSPPITNIALWNGMQWLPLGTGINGSVNTLTMHNGQLIAGGTFTTAGSVSARNVARWNGQAWEPMEAGLNQAVSVLHVHNGSLYAGGNFTSSGSRPVRNLARWDGTAWQQVAPLTNGTVTALQSFDDELIVGGRFSAADDIVSNHLIRWTDGRPSIDAQPTSVSVNRTDTIELHVQADSLSAITYQWRKNQQPLTDGPAQGGSSVLGSNAPVLVITGASLADAGEYDVVLVNDCGQRVSKPATVVVFAPACAGDGNGDNQVDAADLSLLLSLFGQSVVPGEYADFNADGVVDAADLSILLATFGQTC